MVNTLASMLIFLSLPAQEEKMEPVAVARMTVNTVTIRGDTVVVSGTATPSNWRAVLLPHVSATPPADGFVELDLVGWRASNWPERESGAVTVSAALIITGVSKAKGVRVFGADAKNIVTTNRAVPVPPPTPKPVTPK
jgi:hypothetical protein